MQTGVTALLPHPGDLFHEKVPAAAHVINGFGKTTGLVQIQELGTLETPILFTNTLSVGTVYDAWLRHMLALCPDICETTGSVNPVVCEVQRQRPGRHPGPPRHRGARPGSPGRLPRRFLPRARWGPAAGCAATG